MGASRQSGITGEIPEQEGNEEGPRNFATSLAGQKKQVASAIYNLFFLR
jgi:hypothetical protein